jgi:hypothetical protein
VAVANVYKCLQIFNTIAHTNNSTMQVGVLEEAAEQGEWG